MLDFDLITFFAEYAYQPMFVYSFIILFMTASSFGLPIPEEMTLISAGLVAYMARNPLEYPPPFPGAEGVNLTLLAIICFLAVLGSDILIYSFGRVFGKKLIRTKFFNNTIGQARFNKINKIFQKYSYWACGLFRFTPGIRFPGHMICGLMGIPLWKFIMVDGIAALVSVPSQVLLVAFYGDVILEKFKEFKLILLGLIGLVILIWLGKRLYHFIQRRRAI
jgi:membrane protein DedA with SNARE-associated domain